MFVKDTAFGGIVDLLPPGIYIFILYVYLHMLYCNHHRQQITPRVSCELQPPPPTCHPMLQPCIKNKIYQKKNPRLHLIRCFNTKFIFVPKGKAFFTSIYWLTRIDKPAKLLRFSPQLISSRVSEPLPSNNYYGQSLHL